jgi:hypothetical protein
MNNKPEMSRRRTQFNKARYGGLFSFFCAYGLLNLRLHQLRDHAQG